MSKITNELEYKKVSTTDNEKCEENPEPIFGYGFGVRHVQSFLLFLCISILFMARGHLSVTLVGMTNHPNAVKLNKTHIENYGNNTDGELILDLNDTLSISNGSKIEHNAITTTFEKYDWPKSIQEMALGSFFLGYSIMMFPMGLVIQRWGGKIPLQIALALNGVVSLITPWITAWGGWKAVCFCRILQGLSQAGLYPSIQMLFSKWLPLSERGRLSSYVYTGGSLGTLAVFPIAGALASSTWGWPSVFWLVGILCLIMFGIMTVFGAAHPLDHKRITNDEKNFILGHIGSGEKIKLATPWKAILSSKHTWALFAAHMGGGVFFVFFFTQTPSYLHYVLKVNIKNSGTLSSLPYISNCICCIIFGSISDYLTNNNIVSVKSARLLFNSVGSFGAGLCLIATSYTTNVTLGTICFIALNGLQSAIHCGWMLNYLDLAPNFSGAIMATGNTMTNICVVLLPFVTSYFVTDVTDQYQWRIIFGIVSGFVIISNVIFVLFMSADIEEYNDPGKAPGEDLSKNEEEPR